MTATEQVFEQEHWDLRAGLRYDEDGFSSEGYVSPRFAFNYRLGPDTRLSASAGRSAGSTSWPLSTLST